MRCLAENKTEFKEISLKLVENGYPNFNIILSEGTQLNVLKKEKGPQFLVTILALLVADFQKSVNLVRPLNDEQIANLCFDLITDYWAYRFEDFIAFFQLAKKGIYGKIYDRMDYATIQEMLIKYDDQRVNELRSRQTMQQESKDNLCEFKQADRHEQNKGFTSAGPAIGDYIGRLKSLKNEAGR